MVATFIILWALAIILYANNPKELRWAALTAFVGGCGAFGRAVTDTFLPYLEQFGLFGHMELIGLRWVCVICSLLNILGLPYVFAVFSIRYNKPMRERWLTRLSWMLSAPVIVTFFTIHSYYPKPDYRYGWMIFWVGPYIATAFFWFVRTYLKEKNPVLKKSRLLTTILVLPVVFQLFSVYIPSIWGNDQAFRYNTIAVALLLFLFILFISRFNVFGIRLKFERQQLDYGMKLMTSSSAILQHALKNQMAKIHSCAESLMEDGQQSKRGLPHELRIIEQASRHILEMMNRIQENVQDIVLVERHHDISEILDEAVSLMQGEADRNGVAIRKQYAPGMRIHCDRTHVKEVICNLLKNAIEAALANGCIEIEAAATRKRCTVIVRDNGAGIPKTLAHRIFEPFFSTKNLQTNFGLGLPYCYRVMIKHKGAIEIISEEERGTSVYLNFPVKKQNGELENVY